MRYRERMAVRSGGGTTIFRPIGTRTSGRCDGGGAGPMAGRCWPFHSAAPLLGSVSTRSLVPPMVQNLEASTGRAVSTAVGLTRVGMADLDGDGLADLWGEADGQLRAFRGEAPEVWRCLGSFVAAREVVRWPANIVQPAADLDGDGVADTLSTGPRAPNHSADGRHREPRLGAISQPGIRQSQCFGERSARQPYGDRPLGPRRSRDLEDRARSPADLVRARSRGILQPDHPVPTGRRPRRRWNAGRARAEAPGPTGALEIKQPATLPLQVLSGRTGRWLWSAGPLPLGFEAYGYSSIHWVEARVVEPHGVPDVFVRHGSPFVPSSSLTTRAGGLRSSPGWRASRDAMDESSGISL